MRSGISSTWILNAQEEKRELFLPCLEGKVQLGTFALGLVMTCPQMRLKYSVFSPLYYDYENKVGGVSQLHHDTHSHVPPTFIPSLYVSDTDNLSAEPFLKM